jgi:hypothetical protein
LRRPSIPLRVPSIAPSTQPSMTTSLTPSLMLSSIPSIRPSNIPSRLPACSPTFYVATLLLPLLGCLSVPHLPLIVHLLFLVYVPLLPL